MIEGRSGASLPAEAFQCLRVARHFVRQKFKRDEAAEVGIFGLIDHAHAATTELFHDAIV